MNHLHRSQPSRAPAAPPGLVQTRATFGGQLEAARSEWFIQSTEQSVFAMDSIAASAHQASARGQKPLKNPAWEAAASPRITAPAPGTIIALDPDIPARHQRLAFSAEGRGLLRWRMDGREFARGAQAQGLPWPGRHVVQLLGSDGQVADEIGLEVRGAGHRPTAQRETLRSDSPSRGKTPVQAQKSQR
jgi:penicillin-binding protein 1C